MTDPGSVVRAVTEQHEELAGVLAGLADDDWERPTRCEGWSLSDVVLHLAQTDEMAVASIEGRFAERLVALTSEAGGLTDVDQGAAALVARERGLPGPSIRERWHQSASTLAATLKATDEHERVTWVTGELSVRTLATTRLAETWIHAGDVAEAVGVVLVPTDRLLHIAWLAWRTLPYAFNRAGRELTGPVAFSLIGPAGDIWQLAPGGKPTTIVEGDAVELCLVAARRVNPARTSLAASGPDAQAVLELVRTYA